ncbi:MAG: alpha/beta hydrolase [Actinomycetota bacterium]|nr:alpha/beta hydrolase [Actinomycetota bacterium]
MPTLETGPVTLRYETWGDGPPVLLLALGGLRASRIESWTKAPWDPIEALSDRYRVVAMDQRNTGTSFAPIGANDGWPSYAADQLAVMDHLGIDSFSVLGMCIGGAFILSLLAEVPERINAAVALQPIGLAGNRDDFRSNFDDWRAGIAGDHPEATDADWEGFWSNLHGGDDVMWSVPDTVLSTIDTPLLVLQGDDLFHPKQASQHLATTVPTATLIEHWKDPGDQPAARAAVDDFLATHAA